MDLILAGSVAIIFIGGIFYSSYAAKKREQAWKRPRNKDAKRNRNEDTVIKAPAVPSQRTDKAPEE